MDKNVVATKLEGRGKALVDGLLKRPFFAASLTCNPEGQRESTEFVEESSEGGPEHCPHAEAGLR